MNNRELVIGLLVVTWLLFTISMIQVSFLRSEVNALGENLSEIIIMAQE